jgi:hypothetical protein
MASAPIASREGDAQAGGRDWADKLEAELARLERMEFADTKATWRNTSLATRVSGGAVR